MSGTQNPHLDLACSYHRTGPQYLAASYLHARGRQSDEAMSRDQLVPAEP